MRHVIAKISALILLFSGLSTTPSKSAERSRVDITKPMVAGLTKCLSTTQLDCIDSINVLTANGQRLIAKQISFDPGLELDDAKQEVEYGESIWEYTTSAGAANSFGITATLFTPTYLISGSSESVEVEIGQEGETEEEESESTTTKEKIDTDTRFFEPKLVIQASFDPTTSQPNRKKLLAGEQLEIVIRTSWLNLEDVYLPGRNSSIKVESITGGSRVTLAGSEVTLYERQGTRNRITGTVTYSIVTKQDFEFTVVHPKNGAVACADKGYKFSTTNGSSLSLADEQAVNSLKFNASGYSYLPNNSLNKGYAIIKIPLDWVACKFPTSDFSFGEKFDVKVATTDGSNIAQNPTSKAVLTGRTLEVTVENFHFARTEILIETDATAAAARKNAKAQAEIDAKARAEAEAKAKLEAEAKAKAEAEARAKEEAETKAKAEAEAEAKAKAEAAAAAAAAKSASKKITITCVKGKKEKKVTAAKPKCPAGFKKK